MSWIEKKLWKRTIVIQVILQDLIGHYHSPFLRSNNTQNPRPFISSWVTFRLRRLETALPHAELRCITFPSHIKMRVRIHYRLSFLCLRAGRKRCQDITLIVQLHGIWLFQHALRWVLLPKFRLSIFYFFYFGKIILVVRLFFFFFFFFSDLGPERKR